ncbi:aminotransferase [Mesorhizobium sp. ES1-1]|uniref:aminotransferase n=1 Tax=Mesorhizobium sp. ES1-1 TaxID=2876629 RepID=UPI001CCEA896|nr:aminotransferase [Mesorhizobium sp. ES1-1]MBZ9677175.1 aminotransferase class III-fold pyridoxal phosphate-dependent enzyme [Mesorhizobium sp. ES1-1]
MTTHFKPNSVAGRDVASQLHSQTNPTRLEENGPLIVTRGEGIRVFDDSGKSYIDAMAGLWCASLGFNNQRLAAAANRQYGELGFYHTFFNRTHAPATDLAEKLLQLTGMEGGKTYFATSGSEANETMVKLAWIYHTVRGKPTKRKVIARDRAFHGSTIAAASMCGLTFMHREFGLPIAGFLHTLCPDPYRNMLPGESEEQFAQRLADELEKLILREGADTIAAFIAEPINAGGGIIVPPASYFAKIERVLKKYDILCLGDEIVCGFGRTGNWFGKETVGMQPDMMALAKGLSSSYFPISAVVMAGEIYEAVKTFNKQGGSLGHGFTNSGHPVGVAVSLEAIKIYEEMNIVDHVRQMGKRLRGHFDHLAGLFPIIGDVRGEGLMLGIEIVADRDTRVPFDPALEAGPTFDRIAYENGLIGRCMGDTLGFSPPLIVTESDIDEIAERCETSLKQLQKALAA